MRAAQIEVKVVANDDVAQTEIEHDEIDDGQVGQVAKCRMRPELFLSENNEGERIADAADEETDKGKRSCYSWVVNVTGCYHDGRE